MSLKYRFVTFFVFAIFLIVLIPVGAMKPVNLSSKVVVLDAGHGGTDPGSVSGSVYEKDLNLAITKCLAKKLEEAGATVLLTREGDYDLSYPNAKRRKKSDFDNRIAFINGSRANLYLSIHLNYASSPSSKGVQVFYNSAHEKNQKIAELFQKKINETLHLDKIVKTIPSTTYMYDKLAIPGVLVECGFLSNAEELKLLQTKKYQEQIASALAEAVNEYF